MPSISVAASLAWHVLDTNCHPPGKDLSHIQKIYGIFGSPDGGLIPIMLWPSYSDPISIRCINNFCRVQALAFPPTPSENNPRIGFFHRIQPSAKCSLPCQGVCHLLPSCPKRCVNKYWYSIDICEQVISPLHNPDLLFCQLVKLVDQGVYLRVGGLDLAQKECLLVTIFGCMVQGIDLYKQTTQSISIFV
jgi:hypothetical protein